MAPSVLAEKEENAGAHSCAITALSGRPTRTVSSLTCYLRKYWQPTGRAQASTIRPLEKQFGQSWYARKDAPIRPTGKAILANLSPEKVEVSELGAKKSLPS